MNGVRFLTMSVALWAIAILSPMPFRAVAGVLCLISCVFTLLQIVRNK